MHLKRYKGKTVQDALRAVREDLGPQALVLSTRMVPERGVRGLFGARAVEVTAAADRIPMSENRHLAEPPTRPAARKPVTSQRVEDGISARLEAAGIDADFARDIARGAQVQGSNGRRGASAESVRRTMTDRLTMLVAGDEAFAPVAVFVGPPGAGKTTTVAKIAAQERARNGKRLGLVAADGYRVGAVEQLRLYASILGSPLMVARDPGELEDLLDEARRPLLLDTAGRSPNDQASRTMLRVLSGRTDVRTHLVLAASTPVDVARRIFDRFEDARPSRVILTKLDEAETLAALLPVLRERELPISYLCHGQNVPEDMERATAPAIAAWVSGEGNTQRTPFDMEEGAPLDVPRGKPLGRTRGKGAFTCA
jgi:flagellar biosynthesis protein FlhF